jgi:hypothetical protein
MTQLIRYQWELPCEISNKTTRGITEFKRLKAELHKGNNVMRQLRAELNGTKGFRADMGKQLKQFGILAISALSTTAFCFLFRYNQANKLAQVLLINLYL